MFTSKYVNNNIENGMHYKCCIETRGFSSLGFGRN